MHHVEIETNKYLYNGDLIMMTVPNLYFIIMFDCFLIDIVVREIY